MGGLGSGRRYGRSGKDTTEDSLPLDIRCLQRAGVLSPGRVFSWQWTVNDRVRSSIQVSVDAWQVELVYSYTANGHPAESIRQAVMLEKTPCTFGGSRSWFCCPTCAKRVAVIYGWGRLFGCRQCKGLAYASQSEGDADRATRRANRIRKQLGWQAGVLNGPGVKPKGMHLTTYARLKAQHDHLVGVISESIAKQLGFFDRLREEAR
jgi:hypothetical protein